jgi:hypothetical protein
MITAVEGLIERYIWRAEGEENADDDEDRPLDHLGHLLAAAKESVRAALYAGGQLADELAKHRKNGP